MSRKARLALLLLPILPACAPPTGPTSIGDDLGTYQVQASLLSNECGEGHPAPAMLNFWVNLSHLPGSTRGYWKLPDSPQIDGTLERSSHFRFEQTAQVVVIPRDMTMGIPGCTIERSEVVVGTLQAVSLETPDGSIPDAGGDAGFSDAGFSDAGFSDAGFSDAGFSDAGLDDPGLDDAGLGDDHASQDAGITLVDAGIDRTGESGLTGTTTVTISAVPGGNCTALLAVYGGPFPTVPCAIEYELSGLRVGGAP